MNRFPENIKPKFQIGDKASFAGDLWLVVGMRIRHLEDQPTRCGWRYFVARVKGYIVGLSIENLESFHSSQVETRELLETALMTIAEMKAETYRKRAEHIAKLEAELAELKKEVGVHVVGSSEGDVCGFDGCEGTIGFAPVINCSCHIVAPCGNCECNPLHCLTCGRHIETGGKR